MSAQSEDTGATPAGSGCQPDGLSPCGSSQSGIPSAVTDRLERAMWDSRVMASKSDIGTIIESRAYLMAVMQDIASSARGSGPYARDRDADTLAMIERVASAAAATGGVL